MAWIPVQVRSCGSSYFLGADLPACPVARAEVLTALGGPAVVVDPAPDPAADVDCGTPFSSALVAGVARFAVDRGLVPDRDIRVRMAGTVAVVRVSGPGGRSLVRFPEPPGPPAGRVIDGMPVTLIGGGPPVLIARAEEFGLTGLETPTRLEYDHRLRYRIRHLLVVAGAGAELCLVTPSADGDCRTVRVFTGDRVDPAISVRAALAVGATEPSGRLLRLEHPSGFLDVMTGPDPAVTGSTRLILDGRVPGP